MTDALIPGLRYRDGQAAISFLRDAFGFAEQLVIPGPDGTVAHAQLVLEGSMIMLGSSPSAELDQVIAAPAQAGGRATAMIYIRVSDPDAVHARAVAAGAHILLPVADQSFGGRAFMCRDPEGHVWQFGSYDPWTAAA